MRNKFLTEGEGLNVNGVGRDAGHDKAIVVYFNRPLSDDEMRLFHDFVQELPEELQSGAVR